jgi:hypothetical protein
MSKDYRKTVRNLEAVLADDSRLSADDLRQELAEQGVDVDAFLARFGTVVRKGYQQQLRKIAEQEKAEAEAGARNLFGELANKTREELERIFEGLRQGVFGERLKAAALARCRNQVGLEISETELRSWLEDISAGGGA